MGRLHRKVGAVLAAVTIFLASIPGQASPPGEVTGVITGATDAPVEIIELVDYQCPFCKHIHPQLLAWAKEDPRIRLDVREVALISPYSIMAAKAAMAADRQGKRRALHEALMSFRGGLTERLIFDMAKVVGLDTAALRHDMAEFDADYATALGQNLKLGLAHRIRGTPAFLINGRFFEGADLDALHKLVDEEFKKIQKARTPG